MNLDSFYCLMILGYCIKCRYYRVLVIVLIYCNLVFKNEI